MDCSLIFDIINSISIVIASSVAIYGITSWRREAKWKRKYELAEEVLSLFYEVKESFETIRSPFGHTGEGKTRKRAKNEDPEESEIFDSAYVVIERYEREKTPFIKLKSLKYRFMAVYGKEWGVPFEEILKLRNKILSAANRLGNRYWKDQGRRQSTGEQFKKHLEKKHELEGVIWSNFEDEDKIREEIDSIIKKIDLICRTIIEKK